MNHPERKVGKKNTSTLDLLPVPLGTVLVPLYVLDSLPFILLFLQHFQPLLVELATEQAARDAAQEILQMKRFLSFPLNWIYVGRSGSMNEFNGFIGAALGKSRVCLSCLMASSQHRSCYLCRYYR